MPLFDRTGWRTLAFGEFAQNVNERVEPAEAAEEVYVGLEHLDPGNLHIRRWGKGSDVTGTKLRFRKGDIIFGRRRAYQRKLAVAEMDGICSAHAMVVRAKPDLVLPEFLPFLMMSDRFMKRAVEISVGSLSPTINWTTLRCEEFDLPPLEQQRRIAELLWAVDEGAECTWRTHEAVVALRRSAHRDVFAGGFGADRSAARQGELPDGWRVSNVGEVCLIEDRLRRPINAEARAQMQGKFPYYGPTGVLDHLDEYRIEGEYVLIGEDGDHFLKFDVWDMTHLVRGRFNVNNHAHLLRGTESCRTEWVFQYFKHRDITPFLSRQGAGRLKLQKAVLERLPIAIPPLETQDHILQFLRGIDLAFDSTDSHLGRTRLMLACIASGLLAQQ